MTQKNLLYFMNRFNVVFHYAEANFSQGQLVLMQLVHTLLRSTSDLDTIEATHPGEAYHHFLESLRGVRAASEVAQEACRWTSDHREEMADLLAIEQSWTRDSPITYVADSEVNEARCDAGVLGILRLYEKRLSRLQKYLREDLANPVRHDQIMQAYADKNAGDLVKVYERSLGLPQLWEHCSKLHANLNYEVSWHHTHTERGATIL